jgi:hypothetical protein
MNVSERIKLNVLRATIIVAIVGTLLAPPIPQDAAYHQFADQREIWGISNFWNVVTNVPFLVIGLIGAGIVLPGKYRREYRELRAAYLTFFLGVGLVGLGSGYYHLDPSNEALIWDRLPMTVAFMAFCSIVAGERLSVSFGARLLWPLVVVGILSVVYWGYTESLGRGDLRPYALVQFLTGILIPMILLMFGSIYADNRYYWVMLGCYALAKVAEALDERIFDLLGQISGHSLKHVLAASGGFIFCLALVSRVPSSRRA